MYLKKHKEGKFGIEISGYLTNLQVDKTEKTDVCFILGDYDCLTIGEIIKASGYDPKTILNRRLLITIEDEIQLTIEADAKGRCSDCGGIIGSYSANCNSGKHTRTA